MRELPTITHVPPSPGAAYVIQCEDWLPDHAKAQLVDRLVHAFGAELSRVFVLDGGRTLSVIGLEDQRRVPDLLDANNRLHHRNVNLTCAVMRAQGVFIEYAKLHEAKGTEEGAAKARANRDQARYLDDFVQAFGADNAKASAQWFAIRAETLKAALDDLLAACVEDFGSPDGEDDSEAVAHGQAAAGGPIEPSAVTFGHLRRAQAAVAGYWTQEGPGPVVPIKEAGPVVAGGQALVSAFMHTHGMAAGGPEDAVDVQGMLREFVAFAADQLKARVGSCSVAVVAEPGKGSGLRLVTDGDQQ